MIVVDLQEESSETDDTSEAGAGEGDLASGGNGDLGGGLRLAGGLGAGRLGLLRLALGRDVDEGGVGVARGGAEMSMLVR